jgi:hypothetical protein
MTQVKINKTDFIADVNAGLTRNELKAKYAVPVDVINAWANQLELKIAIKKTPKYVLVDDSQSEQIAIEENTTVELTEQESTPGF